jgi:hypothetical protein
LGRNDRDSLGGLEPGERVALPRTGASAQGLAGPDLFRRAGQDFRFSAKTTRLIGQEVSLGLKLDSTILRRGDRRLERITRSLSRHGSKGGAQASFHCRHFARQRLGLCQFVTHEVIGAHATPSTLERGDFSVDPVQVSAQLLVLGCQTLA